jgi:uncharacterized repeat protein (TIGR01451 family)
VDQLVPGQQAQLTLLVLNAGSVDAPAPVVQDLLPPGLTFAGALSDGWDCASDDGQLVTCAAQDPAAAPSSTLDTLRLPAPDSPPVEDAATSD